MSAFVAVAMVAGVAGWLLRGAQSAAVPSQVAFSGGGTVLAPDCGRDVEGITVENAQILVLDAAGKELASSRLMGPTGGENGCLRAFVIDKIPGGRGIYTLQVGRWKKTFTEAVLRDNLALVDIR